MSSRLDAFDGLVAEQEHDAERARVMLRAAAESVNTECSGGYAMQALRVRGAAILAATAASALQELAGVYALAAAVTGSELLDEESERIT